MTLDLTKPVQTRDGRRARIIATDVKWPEYPICAIVETGYGEERCEAFSLDGKFILHEECPTDLINVPEEAFAYFNLYEDFCCRHNSEAEAKLNFNASEQTGVTVRLVSIDGKFNRLEVL